MSTELGERFARAVAEGRAEALKELLVPAVSFRALTPDRVWESRDADQVVDDVILGSWFPPGRITQVLAVDGAKVGTVDRVGYRFRAELPDGAFIVEQQAYWKSDGDRISWLRILCSGFVRAE
jgi:hypothetical protein